MEPDLGVHACLKDGAVWIMIIIILKTSFKLEFLSSGVVIEIIKK